MDFLVYVVASMGVTAVLAVLIVVLGGRIRYLDQGWVLAVLIVVLGGRSRYHRGRVLAQAPPAETDGPYAPPYGIHPGALSAARGLMYLGAGLAGLTSLMFSNSAPTHAVMYMELAVFLGYALLSLVFARIARIASPAAFWAVAGFQGTVAVIGAPGILTAVYSLVVLTLIVVSRGHYYQGQRAR